MADTYAETCHCLQLRVCIVMLTVAQRGAEHIDIEH